MKLLRATLGQKLIILYLLLFSVCFSFNHFYGTEYIRTKVAEDTCDLLKEAGTVMLTHHIERQPYTKNTIRNFQSHIEVGAETAGCRIMIINTDGDLLIDTDNPEVDDNVYRYDASFLHQDYAENFKLGDLTEEPVLIVPLPITNCVFLNGYIVMLSPMSQVEKRTEYYFNILDGMFFILMATLLLAFLAIYISNTIPLRKLIREAKAFSIRQDNPPIKMFLDDEYRTLAETLNVIGDEMSKFDEYQKMFIANISHDFRSPLTSIRGYAEAILDDTIPFDRKDKYLKIILNETDRLNGLTSDLIALNTFDKNNVFIECSVFDIHECILNTIDILEGAAGEKNIIFDLEFSIDCVQMVNADKRKIQQVLHNLIDNAIKFSHSDSQIEIKTKRKGEKVFVSIKDSGIGISKENINKIWERFYKMDLSRGKDRSGTGLGLCICREIITAHDQTINVISTKDVGSEFIFTLQKG